MAYHGKRVGKDVTRRIGERGVKRVPAKYRRMTRLFRTIVIISRDDVMQGVRLRFR